MELFDDEYVKLSLDESVPCLEWIGKKYMSSAVYRASVERGVRLYRQYKGKYPLLEGLINARDIGPISSQDTQWVADEILPRFAAAGMKKEAIVVPASAVGRMVIKNYESQAGKKIEIKVFDNVEAAKNWLKT